MDKQHFLQLIKSPAIITETNPASLLQLIKDYPYFHSAYLLLIKNIKSNDDINYEQALHDYSLRVADRKVLFNLVHTSEIIEQNIEGTTLKDDIEKITSTNDKLIDLAEEIEVPENLTDINNESFHIIEDEEEKAKVIEFDIEPVIESKDQNKPHDLIDNFLSSLETPAEEEIEISDQASLIDKFITENPVFAPNKLILSDQQEDISVNSISEDEELVSETLAQVFETQKLFDKAIGVYEKLILKFPEKSTYFASRIEELRLKSK